jgi:DNA-binding Xre family transcriptional regulator
VPNLLQLLVNNIDEIFEINRLRGKEPQNRAQLAKTLETSPQNVSKIFVSNVRLDTLEKLAKALGVAPYRLLLDRTDRNRVDLDIARRIVRDDLIARGADPTMFGLPPRDEK